MVQPAYHRSRSATSSAIGIGAVYAVFVACSVVPSFAAEPAKAPSIESITFATTQQMPVVRVPPDMQAFATLVQRGIAYLPEGSVLQGAVAGAPASLRLSPDQSASLRDGFKKVYGEMAADPQFARLPSALSLALSQDAKRPGHYFLRRPAQLSPRTRVIVFLHGFGGNFQFYSWLLRGASPDDIVVCPSYGLAWTRHGATYLDEVLADVEERLGIGKSRPWLMAISAGGPAAFAIYNRAPARFSGLVSLASCPDLRDVDVANKDLNVLMVNGLADDRFPFEAAREVMIQLHPRIRRFESVELDSDHFFLLTKPQETFAAVKAFMK
jgi:predicted esterase